MTAGGGILEELWQAQL